MHTAPSMALEGPAVKVSPATRHDHIDDIVRSGRLWTTRAEQLPVCIGRLKRIHGTGSRHD